MTNPVRIQPDLQFIKDLQEVGGDTLKKCYQCATCSVACPLSPADNPYPRKEMIWAQWGLKDKLVNDIDIWLCHNCGTCSDLCPRGAKPGDLLSALRNMAYRNLVEPAIIGKWMSSSKYLHMLIALPAILWAVIWLIRGSILGSFFPYFVEDGHGWKVAQEGGNVIYGGLFPGDFTIDPLFGLTALFVMWSFYKGVKKQITSFDVPRTLVIGGEKKEKPSIIKCIIDVVLDEIVTHRKWKQCGYETEGDEQKFKGHWTLFFGFVALAIVTSVVAVTHWGGKIIPFLAPIGHTPMVLFNPVKILANVGAILLLYGLTMLTKRRLAQNETKHGSSFYDWYLLGVIWVVALTGLFCELLRWANVAGLAYPMYYIHLVSVMMLIGYLPWSKLGHLVYRTAALVYARYVGRVPMAAKEEKIFIL
ncbi:MAG: quinone-interacting membrane-bound oxidoreductase complex subunit QmoC [Desulfovibrio sp.]|uniref:quinone-interacting membrane-bound oxidoreductase complex subunit QmoC n=1 Tax=Desulfovibrio sp. 7SRBS1 TaxID=3378064 RepID=UPI003B3D70BA